MKQFFPHLERISPLSWALNDVSLMLGPLIAFLKFLGAWVCFRMIDIDSALVFSKNLLKIYILELPTDL